MPWRIGRHRTTTDPMLDQRTMKYHIQLERLESGTWMARAYYALSDTVGEGTGHGNTPEEALKDLKGKPGARFLTADEDARLREWDRMMEWSAM